MRPGSSDAHAQGTLGKLSMRNLTAIAILLASTTFALAYDSEFDNNHGKKHHEDKHHSDKIKDLPLVGEGRHAPSITLSEPTIGFRFAKAHDDDRAPRENESFVDQAGVSNWATVNQDRGHDDKGGGNLSAVLQEGYKNWAVVNQTATGKGHGYKKLLEGDSRSVGDEDSKGGDNYRGSNSSLVISEGAFNGAVVNQDSSEGANNQAVALQVGYDNNVISQQGGHTDNTSLTVQFGKHNTAIVSQK